MKKKTIGILLIILVFFISISAISAADANETLMEEVSDTEIATTSVAVDEDNAISPESESGGDVEINVTDSRDENHKVRTSSASNDVLSASNDDLLKHSSKNFLYNGEWYYDLEDAWSEAEDNGGGTIMVWTGYYKYSDDDDDFEYKVNTAVSITLESYGNGPVIFDGGESGWFLRVTNNNVKVTINDITFKNCKGKDGGAIEVEDGAQLTLNNCVFESNHASSDGVSYGLGGAIVVDEGTLVANNCRFINNKADRYGGAICIEDKGSVTLDNCYFEGNKKGSDVANDFDDYSLDEDDAASWTFNYCLFKGHGSLEIEVDAPTQSVEITPDVEDDVNLVVLYKNGSYYTEKPWASFHSVEFTDLERGTYTVYMMKNHEKRYIYSGNTFTISDSFFILDDKDAFGSLSAAVNAIPDGGSGVITVEAGTYTGSSNFNVQIRNKVVTIMPKIISEYMDTVIFKGNSQNYLLDVGDNAQLILEDIVITGKFSNAALIFTSNLKSSITDCEFNNIKNSQNQSGTPIDAQNSKLELNGTTFDLNGPIMLKNTVATIDECDFTNNTGSQGGAINANPSTDLTITSSEFTRNDATTEGGAIYATNLKIEDTTFMLNTAETGGAVYITDSSESLVNITACVFDSNIATNQRNIFSKSPTRKFNLEFNEYDLNLTMNQKDASYGSEYILNGKFDWGSNLNNTFTLLSGTIDDENVFGDLLTVEDNKFNINLGVLTGGTHELAMEGMYTQGDSNDHFYTHVYYSDLNGNEFYLINPAYLKVVIAKAKILLNLEVKDVLIPEIPVLNLHANWDNNYTIFIGNKYYQLEVVNGKGSMPLPGLDLGNYSVVAMRDADENFNLAMNFTTFSVSKTYSNFLVVSTNVEYDTLAQAVANSGNEDTIYVKNGTYKDIKIVISNKTLDIIALETVVFDAQGGDANFIIVNENSEVYIYGITFRGIHNRNTNYGAIVNHGYLSLDSCNFTDNKITKTSFAGNGGAAIFSDGESLEIDNCNFINNAAPLKVSTAAVTSLGYEDISITDSKFINNTAREGGAVHFKNISQFESAIYSCDFEQNTAVKGSAIYIGNNSRYASVSLSNFVKNNIKNSLGEKVQLEGGVIYVNANTTEVTIDIGLSNFENNANNDVDGGVLCLDGSSNAFIEGCTFNNNSGKLGSAILIKNPNNEKLTLFIDSSTFTNNHATTGAVATSPKVIALIEECIFMNNTGESRHIYSNGFTVAHDTVFEVGNANLKASTVSYGNNSIIKGTADIGTNIYTVANLTVAGKNVTSEIKDNKFSYNAGVLDHGKYTAVLNNIVDMNNNTYVMDTISVTFKVNRASIDLNVSVDNITYGETLKVVETLPSTALGTITYQFNGKEYTKDELESLKLDAGKYTLVASYNDEYFAPSSSTVNFEVYKANPTISVEDVEVEDNGTVIVNIKTNVPSIYTIEIGDYKTDKYVNGSRAVVIDEIFEPGTYTIKVTSQERVNYISNSTEATLKVTKNIPAITLNAFNKNTNGAILSVSAPENAVGNITYTITDSNKNIVKTLTQSCRDDLIVSDLDDGEYEISAVFEGDDLYYSTSNIETTPLSMKSAINENILAEDDDEYYYPFIYQEDEDSDYEYYETLEEAIDAASLMGGIITVRGGTYYYEEGNAGIDIEGEAEITIRAFAGEEVIFDCQHASDFLYLTYDTEVEIIETAPPIPIIYTTEGPTITLENLTVINGYAVSDGGVIEMDAGSLTLLNCNFYNNEAEYGGVIYIGSLTSDQDADVIAFNTTFINNTARSEGGAIYISEGLEQFVSASFYACTFLDNYQGEDDERTMNYFAGDAADEIVKKACIFNAKDTVTWSMDKINQTITVIGTSTDVFDSIVLLYFDHIPLYSIYNNGSQKFNVTFEDVMGGNYTIGVMNDHDLNTYIFKDASFEMIVPNFIISADEVYENLTDAIGNVTDNGIIYANANYHIDENMEINISKSFTLTNFRDRMVVFDGNSTNWFFTVAEGCNVVIENIEFVDGGIKDYASIENYGSLTLKNCTFTSFENGTVIYNKGFLNITNGEFSLNSIENTIVLNDNQLLIDSVEFSYNVINTNSLVYNNGNAEIVSSNFTENINNGNGGAIYNKNSLTIKDTVFSENEGINGGAVYNEGTLEVSNSDFEDNTANGYGGAIFNNGEANITNSSFSGGFSAKDGGAIYNNNILIVNNSTLIANTATGISGAIYNNKSLEVKGSFFGINFAYDCANIYNAGDIQFSENTFDFYDVILYVPDGQYEIPTTITGTLNPQFNMDLNLTLPGFVNHVDATVTITDGIFEYNTTILPKGAYDVILNEVIYDTNDNIYHGEAISDRLIVNKANVYINLTVDDMILKNSDKGTPVLKINASKNGTFQILFNNKLTTHNITGTQAEITLDSVEEGNYSVMVVREGDENYNDAVNATTFTVSEYLGNFIVNSTGGKFDTLKDAINNSSAEDIIYVMEGTYTGEGNLNVEIQSNKKLTITALGEVVFDGNTTELETSFISFSYGDVTLEDIIFTGFKNKIIKTGGYMTIDGCTFVNNTFTRGEKIYWGMIYNNGNLNIVESEFYDNTLFDEYLIYNKDVVINGVYVKSNITINGSIFENNTLSSISHIINIDNANSVKVISTEFAENTLIGGSLIHVQYCNDVLISSDFYNNTQGAQVIFALNNTNLNIENSTFIGNILPQGYIINLTKNNQSIISECTFTDNNVNSVVLSKDKNLSVLESTFSSNTISYAGAIMIDDLVNTTTVDGCMFVNNKADLYRNIFSPRNMNIKNSVFDTLNVDFNVIDINYGETETIYGTFDIGINLNFTVNININNKIYSLNVSGNKFTYNLSNLTGGEYTVVLNATDNNSNTFIFNQISKTFTVNRIDSGLKVTISNITQGEKLKINANLTNNATDKILYQLNGIWYNETQMENITLSPGIYLVAAAYTGNKNYLPNTTLIYVQVYKSSANITVSDVAVNYGDEIKINVSVGAADYYTVFLGDEDSTLYIADNATFTFPSENLKPGIYKIVVYTFESDNHSEAYANATLTVNKAKGVFKLSDDTIVYGENAIISVEAPISAYGNITYKVYNQDDKLIYNITQSCLANLTVFNLPTGIYTVNGTFEGDFYYTTDSTVISGTIIVYTKVINLNITVSDINYGENATVIVESDVDGEYTVKISDKTYLLTVINGKGNITVENLASGNYTAVVTIEDGSYYAYNKTEFNVVPMSVPVEISVEDIKYGENATVYIKTEINGEYIVKVSDKPYTVNVVNGSGNVTIVNPDAGTYTASVTIADTNYTVFNETEFTVDYLTGNVEISVGNITYGENATVVIKADIDGKYIVEVDGKNYIVDVLNGSGNVTIVNLAAGTYTANVTIADGNYSAFNETEFSVAYITGNVTIFVDDIISGQNATAFVFASFDGKYIVEVDGKIYTVDVLNGSGNVTIANLVGGTYTASVTIADANYSAFNETEFSVTYTSRGNVNISVADISYGENATVFIHADIDGEYIVRVSGKNYPLNVSKGNGNVTLVNLPAGVHIINVTIADAQYYAFNETMFIVNYISGNVNMIIEDITYGENATVVIKAEIDGKYIVEVDDKNYTVDVVNGKGNITIENLTVGTYTATVTIADINYTAFNETEFTVDYLTGNVNISVADITYGENATVLIRADIDGEYIVRVSDKNYTVDVVGGRGNITLVNLAAGTYTANVTIADGNYSAFNKTEFKVDGKSAFVYIFADNIKYGEEAVVFIYGEIDGEYIVRVSDKKYTVNLEEGIGNLTLESLTAGNYTINVTIADTNYFAFNETEFNVANVSGFVYISVGDISYGENAIVFVYGEIAGKYIVSISDKNYTVDVVNGRGNITVENLAAGTYIANVTIANGNYTSSGSTTFNVAKINSDIDIDFKKATWCNTSLITLLLPEDASGDISIYVNGILSQIVDLNTRIIAVSNLTVGDNNISVVYSGDNNYNPSNKTVLITRNPSIIASNMVRGYNSGMDYTAQLFDCDGNPLVNVNVTVTVNAETFTVLSDSEGIVKFNQALAVGDYSIGVFNPQTNESQTTTLKILGRITDNKDLSIFFADGSLYNIRITGDDGNYVGAGETVAITVGGVTYNVATDQNGYANLKLSLAVETYTVTATYKGFTTQNTVKVNSVVKPLKMSVKVKKTAKTFKIKVKLKSNTVLKKKRVYLNIKGKTFNAKTNSKGIATFKVTKKVIKKLKNGKKYKAVFTYKANANGKVIRNTAYSYVRVK